VITPKLTLTDAAVTTTAAVDALVVGTVQGADGPRLAPGSEDVAAAFDGGLVELLTLLGASGKADEVVKLPTRGTIAAPLLVATGLGKVETEPTAEQVRRAAGAAARALAGTSHAVTTLSQLHLTAAAEGAALGAYTFGQYRSRNEDQSRNGDAPLARVDLAVSAPRAAAAKHELARAVAVAEARRTDGVPSSSRIETVASDGLPSVVPAGGVPRVTVNVSSVSSRSSWATVNGTVAIDSPAANPTVVAADE